MDKHACMVTPPSAVNGPVLYSSTNFICGHLAYLEPDTHHVTRTRKNLKLVRTPTPTHRSDAHPHTRRAALLEQLGTSLRADWLPCEHRSYITR